MNGIALLKEFKEARSDRAFAEVVARYRNLVYSVAKRRVADLTVAQDITQLVFLKLARSVPAARNEAELLAWLHRTTVNASIDLWRSEIRRRAREKHAAAMQHDPSGESAWNGLAPVIDEALNELNQSYRQTILLRFFEQKTMRDLGAFFGISEDAAKMRVSRALERLRHQLSARGVACGATALGSMLAEQWIEAAPATVISALAGLQVPVSSSLAGSGFVAAVLFAGVATVFLLGPGERRSGSGALNPQQIGVPAASAEPEPPGTALSSDGTTDAAEAERDPDPLDLLRSVVQARRRAVSGFVELQLASESFLNGRKQTNASQFKVLFEGNNLRFEQIGREYAYALPGDEAKPLIERIEREQLDNATAVRLGLLKGFETRHVTVWDGETVAIYRESDGKPGDTNIDKPGRTGTYTFDPRCLGLTPHFSPTSIEACLGYEAAKSIVLVGKELVDGVLAWRVSVKLEHDQSLDFWIDVARSGRVIKHASGKHVVLSKYDDANPHHPIPVDVTVTEDRNGARFSHRRIVQSKAQLNIPVSPGSFTLAGLGMPVGTPVNDLRIKRRIGYWTGIGLSEQLPSRTEAKSESAPDVSELLALLENDPASQSALESAAWILLNYPDGPEVEQAADVILREHIGHPDLAHMCIELERVRHRCSTKLLSAILDRNLHSEVRAAACYSLARIRKHEAKYGSEAPATAEALALWERLSGEFGNLKHRGYSYAHLATPELYELRELTIGRPAPETVGPDLEGQLLRLSDYRGSVVVLVFWTATSADTLSEINKMLHRFADKSSVLIGVHCDDDLLLARKALEKFGIRLSSFADGRFGPIRKLWNVNRWPDIWVLDGQGIIRHRGLRGPALAEALQGTLSENERVNSNAEIE